MIRQFHIGRAGAKLARDARGATIIEFALVAPIFFFIIFLMAELGLVMFTQIALESVTMQVSRSASIGGSTPGCDRVCTIKNLVQQKTLGLINSQNVTVTANTLAAGGTTAPDYCLVQGNPEEPTGVDAAGQCICPGGSNIWVDVNNNHKCDVSGNLSLGNAGDLVEIRVSYPWKLMIPFLDTMSLDGHARQGTLFGANKVLMLSSSTIVKNEPF